MNENINKKSPSDLKISSSFRKSISEYIKEQTNSF